MGVSWELAFAESRFNKLINIFDGKPLPWQIQTGRRTLWTFKVIVEGVRILSEKKPKTKIFSTFS